MAVAHADRNLLFGILALQMDFLTREALIRGMQAWTLEKGKALGQILVEQGALSPGHYALLDPLVEAHIRQHGNDAQKSLATVGSVESVREQLRQIADPDVQASIAHVPAARPEEDPYTTRSQSAGTPTSAGLRFRILRPHARGGLGQVSVARDEELGREVALKEIQERHADQPESRARFVLEAEVTGQLEHPGIVPVYGLGAYADGRPFYAMRFIRGDSLKDAIERFHQADVLGRDPGERALALRQLLRRFVDVCNAIAYAHSRGVLHRDLKPGNVMLGQYGETLVVDWGLAKVKGREVARPSAEAPVQPSVASGSAPTEMGRALGTPAYMSPEQAAGRLDRLGPATDVYSLGATLYCLLTGKAPFADGDVETILKKLAQGDFPPPRQVKADVPPALEAVCLKAMALEPEARYPGALALAADVEHWLGDEPVAAYPEPLPARVRRWGRRHRVVVTGAAMLLVTAVVALAVSTVLIGQEQQKTAAQKEQAEKALEGEQQARKERALAQVEALRSAGPQAVPAILAGLVPFRQDVLPRLGELWAAEGGPGYDARRARVGLALLPVDPAVKARLYAWMLQAGDPQEMLLLRDALRSHGAELAADLWKKVDAPQTSTAERFRALVALAAFDGDNPRWAKAGGPAVEQLLAANPLHLGLWTEALRPVRAALVAPLAEVFRSHKQAERRLVAANVLADYIGDRPEVLADLAADAEPEQYAVLRPLLEAHREEVVALFLRELARTPRPDWQDGPLDPAWTAAAPALAAEIEQAEGMLAERFALCQALPLERLEAVTEGLRPSGYRPVRVRPYRAGEAVRVAVVWARDGRRWRLASGLSAEDARKADEETRGKGLVAVDVAGYVPTAVPGADSICYAALWAQPAHEGEEARLYLGVTYQGHVNAQNPLKSAGFLPLTIQVCPGPDGQPRYSGVWVKYKQNPATWNVSWDMTEPDYQARSYLDEVLLDLHLSPAPPPIAPAARYADQLARAENTLRQKPNDVQALYQAGQARYRLGQDVEALAALDAVVAANPGFARGYQFHALVHARLGNAAQARRALALLRDRSTSAGLDLAVPAIVSAYLGEDAEGMARLEEAVAAAKADGQVLYNAAEACAQAAHIVRTYQTARLRACWAFAPGLPVPPFPLAWLEQQQKALADAYAERAVALLRQAVDQGYADYKTMQSDPNFDALREAPGFVEVLKKGHLERQYAAVWHASTTRESAESHGLDAAAHLARCRLLAAEGYRPAALSVAVLAEEAPPVAASVWQRPFVSESVKDALAKRQAQAAVALVQLGQEESVWPLLRHSPDPGRRSYLLHGLAKLGTDPAALLRRLKTEPDLSARRALLLALGAYEEAQLPGKEQEVLLARLRQDYQVYPDPGLRSAAEWLLRRWGHDKELRQLEDGLRGQPAGKRDWYVSKEGHTLAIVRGPVEFLMGSPAYEPDRFGSETLHRRRIPRSFAIATKQVTVAQFQRFLKDRPEVKHSYTKKFSPEPDGPIISVTWFEAAQYCNWLSAQEGIPEDEWCYPKDVREGMVMPVGYLHRTGYRLPTEAEWEHACRAGSLTSRAYGASTGLLGEYAWYFGNTQGVRTRPVGQLKPNDLGLFDMHGNVWTWCQDRYLTYPTASGGKVPEDQEDLLRDIKDVNSRVLRGGSFLNLAWIVRSANRFHERPAYRSAYVGLRVARTYP